MKISLDKQAEICYNKDIKKGGVTDVLNGIKDWLEFVLDVAELIGVLAVAQKWAKKKLHDRKRKPKSKR